MNTKYRNSAAVLFAAVSLTFSPAAWSLGLGDITVESYLNQPLQVRIDLISRESDDLASVSAQLASAKDYELIGADRESVSVPVSFTIEDIEGDAYILGTSKLPLSSPVVRLILEVNWSSGRMLREYTVFLDPPTFDTRSPIPRVDKRSNPPAVAEPAAEAADTQASVSAAEPPPAQEQSRPAEVSQSSEGEYGPVSNGETLWAIARDWSRGSGLDINKVMIAIQRENPDAFLRGNINLLKRGAILRMPQVDFVESIATAAAINEVSAQAEEFRGRRSAEAVASPSTPLLADEASAPESPPASREAETVPSDPGTAAEESLMEARDQLELVPPSEEADLDSAYGFEEAEDGAADASVSVTTLREDLARKEEELITQQQENEYLEDRLGELEAQLAQAKEDAVRDANLANMEERLRQERLASEAEAGKRDSKSWYTGLSAWLIGLLVLAAAAAGWFLSRRGGGDEVISELGSGDDPLREIKGEAEEVLRVLEEPADDHKEAAGDEEDAGDIEAPEDSPEDDREVQPFGATGDDAEVLDEESSDPEIQLDLARAYISMGDKEAARVILEEVGINGSEEQQEEAKKMLELLVPDRRISFPMTRFAIGLEYDGSEFLGWQIQSQEPTVQGCLEKAVSSVADHEARVVCCGRTDTGVHAIGQVAHFDTAADRPERSWILGLNSMLPGAVSVLWIREVDDSFHARFSAFSRSYRYQILNRWIRPALEKKRVSWCRSPLDADKMNEAAQALLGEHDFTSFRASACQARHAVREIQQISVQRETDVVSLDITANGFLYHMVRNIAGSLIRVGLGEAPVSWMKEILEKTDRAQAAPTAPPEGLYFMGARYPEHYGLPASPLAFPRGWNLS